MFSSGLATFAAFLGAMFYSQGNWPVVCSGIWVALELTEGVVRGKVRERDVKTAKSKISCTCGRSGKQITTSLCWASLPLFLPTDDRVSRAAEERHPTIA